ncbi:MAG: ATP-dependent DNA helicase RecG [Dehalococcoidia bacterium]|nr:ATP-dependent DNA helicase RecG [Dehalococcoidia bacterium]
MSEAVQRLRKVLTLERSRRFADTAVIGGLDAYLRNFLAESALPPEHRFQQLLRSLPPGGYRALHPVQRQRVIEELEKALSAPLPQESPSRVEPRESKRAAAPRPARPKPTPPPPADPPLEALKGVSRAYAAKLRKLGIEKVSDLLWLFPFRYHDFSEVRPVSKLVVGEEQTVLGEVFSAGAGLVGRRRATEALVQDSAGAMLRVVWWGQTYLARQLKTGMKVALSGKVTAFRGRLQMENPEWEPLEGESLHTRRLVPVYPGTEGLPQRLVRRLAREAVEARADGLEETLPDDVRRRLKVPPLPRAMRGMHVPVSPREAQEARRRFALEELLYIELGVVRRRRLYQEEGSAPQLALPPAVREGFESSLPFGLTAAQRRAIDEVLRDIGGSVPMSRLLEGDVGSGKTVVAATALLAAVAGGYQGAIMAPTEVLAEQHYRTFCALFSNAEEALWRDVFQPEYLGKPLRVTLLRGSLKASEKAAAQDSLARGETDIAIGTQALIQGEVSFQRLGLVVVDEQHRFGVEQRAALRQKGASPHVLVMTATPIPRTLALTVYGDLDLSVLDEMPPGRPPVKTYRLRPDQRQQAYDFLHKQVQTGRQAYVICPLVEESEAVAARAAVQEYERLCADVFPDLRLGLLHGRMTPGEKDAVMRAFRDGELDVLVSTAVVEVGIDVPNATVMLVEGADRFGLAQLHQFRGRVRRSSVQAYCLLLSENPSEEAQERLRIIETTHDGFKLAEEDLRIRGPGEYFGTRQSGLPDLKVARLTDVALIEQARAEAIRLLDGDPELSRPEHRTLAARMSELWGRITAEVS